MTTLVAIDKDTLRGRFWQLDAGTTKHFDAAYNGTLPAEYLYTILPPLGSLRHRTDQYGMVVDVVSLIDSKYESATTPISAYHSTCLLTVAIPDLTTFSIAWTKLTSLMGAGASDPAEGVRLMFAMNEYFSWLAWASTVYTWKSVCHYHILFTGPIFREGGSAERLLDHGATGLEVLVPK
ncbi:hypothetical protein Q8F55_003593 [Vanrija albida]|uniref:Uncharacterized protein n=1 Tax=Vanrija albida TaxID=181172 RepID=A0ABR3Q4D6_9TREE